MRSPAFRSDAVANKGGEKELVSFQSPSHTLVAEWLATNTLLPNALTLVKESGRGAC